ncbi:MAG: hypothetical protein KDF59_05255 [Nitrosomonas sp.]|nr:hypothetical protein [Nitrosomonas sp.]
MLSGNRKTFSLHPVIIGLFIFGIHQIVIAQPEIQTEHGRLQQQSLSTASPTPIPGVKPHSELPPVRSMQRIGTAINGARNSVSIKSTDAGIVHRPAAPSAPLTPMPQFAPNCIHCGIVDFINIAPESMVNAIASGMIAGTIARKIGGHGTHQDTQSEHRHHRGHHQQHYQVGVTMQDGSQQVIVVPDISGLQRGNRVQLKDGILMPE